MIEKFVEKILTVMMKKENMGDNYRQIIFPPKSSFLSSLFRFLLIIVCILIETFLIFGVSEKSHNVILQLSILILVYPYLIIKTIIGFKKLMKKIQKDKSQYIEDSLTYIISSNQLFEECTENKEEIDSNGRVKIIKEKRITRYIHFGYKIDKNNIYVRVYKFGNKLDEVANKLGPKLQASLGYRLESVVENIQYVDYLFKIKEDTRLILRNSDNIVFNNTDEIFLTEQLSFRLSKHPHILIGGVTGGGKTTLINYLILELLKMKSTIFILDNKNSDLASLKSYFGNEFVGSSANESARITRLVREEMEERFKEYKENSENFVYGYNFLDYHLKPIILIVDELGALRASADKKVFSEIISNLTSIVLKGREMGVFLILSTQQPNSQNIPTELRDNLSVRISLGNLSDEAYKMCFNEVPEETVQNVGEGYIFLDNFTKAKKIQFPYVEYKTFNFIEELKKIQKLINENERR